jgi:hypothetical protein
MNNLKELKFIHITKNGGTSIEKTAQKHNILWGKYDTEYKYHTYPNKNKFKSWHDVLCDKDYINKYDWFMVVRNPYTRILSEYNCDWGGIGQLKTKQTKEEMNRFLIKTIHDYQKIYQNKPSRMKFAPGHYRVQSDYLLTGTKLYILKFESLSTHFNKLMEIYGLSDLTLEHHNSSSSKKNPNDFTIEDFSDELITLINKVYYDDFTNFGYEMK